MTSQDFPIPCSFKHFLYIVGMVMKVGKITGLVFAGIVLFIVLLEFLARTGLIPLDLILELILGPILNLVF